MKEDKTLVCRECGTEFVFSASEQEFYKKKASQMNPAVALLPSSSQTTYGHQQRAPGSRNVPCYLRRMRSRHRSTVPSFHGSSGILPRMLQCSQRLIINEVKKPIA